MNGLQVKKATITQEAVMKTENASYNVTYSVSDNKLQSLSAIIQDVTHVEGPSPNGIVRQYEQLREVGRITVDGYGHVSMPTMSYSEKLPLYMSDFGKIIRTVQRAAQPEEATQQETGTE